MDNRVVFINVNKVLRKHNLPTKFTSKAYEKQFKLAEECLGNTARWDDLNDEVYSADNYTGTLLTLISESDPELAERIDDLGTELEQELQDVTP